MMAALKQLSGRLASSIIRGVVSLVDDDTKMQMLQVGLRANEVRDDIERFQQYGFTAHPHPGAECLALGVGGNREHTVVIAVDDRRYRLTSLVQGEVALYDDLGQTLILKRTGIEVTGLNVTIKELNAGTGTILLQAQNIQLVAGATLTTTAPATAMNAAGTFILTAPSVDLGGVAGPPVARIGDHVDNNSLIDTGSTVVRSI